MSFTLTTSVWRECGRQGILAMSTGWEPSHSLCLPWHSSWNDVALNTSSLLINSMVGLFSLQCSLLHCSDLHRCDLTLCCPVCRQPQIPWRKAAGTSAGLVCASWLCNGRARAGEGCHVSSYRQVTFDCRKTFRASWVTVGGETPATAPANRCSMLPNSGASVFLFETRMDCFVACTGRCFHICSHVSLAQEVFPSAQDFYQDRYASRSLWSSV